MVTYFYDNNLVRYEFLNSHSSGTYNWLFFPGGPGVDSTYFHSLTDILKPSGNVWLIDLPGNGGNTSKIDADYDFNNWFNIFLSVVQKFEKPILVGHSFGGMFPLLFPELEQYLTGFIILNSAPSLWLSEAVYYAKNFDLPTLSKEMQEFTENPNQESFKIALDACMPYYFPKKSLDKGRTLLSNVPFPFQPAVWWQRKAFELNFSAKWIPQNVPTLIIGGTHDCICPFSLFQKDARFQRSNIEMNMIEDAGHFGWIEKPESIKKAFTNFVLSLQAESN